MSASPDPRRTVSSRMRTGVFRTPTGLREVFSAADIDRLVPRARRPTISTFHHATVIHRGRRKGTDNCIIGVGPKRCDLAEAIRRFLKQPLITTRDLPQGLIASLSRGEVCKLQWELTFAVLLEGLERMCIRSAGPSRGLPSSSGEIWYDQYHGSWQITQTCIEEITGRRSQPRRVKDDDRSYHGRNRGQSDDRGVPGGVSISFS